MRHIFARNVSEALYLGVQALDMEGVRVETRNGPALEFPTPVCTTYTHSRERVLFYPERDANPFFHLFESLWMLAGRNDVSWISSFNSRIDTFSDDGKSFHGAYGYRWKFWFGFNQLEVVISRLINYENDRRAVLSMWDARSDLMKRNSGKDYPCNTQIFFSVRNDLLDMTVVNRSNDMIWGAYGANAVHMSILQEYVAARLEIGVGTYYQFSNNLHAYLDTFETVKNIKADYDPYLLVGEAQTNYTPSPLVDEPILFDLELLSWFEEEEKDYANSFLSETATPMLRAWKAWKNKNLEEACSIAKETIVDLAWKKACVEWLNRRKG